MPESRPGAASLRILHQGDGIAVAEIGRVCVVLWREAVTPHRFDLQRVGLAEVVRKHPDGAGFLCVIEPTSSPPEDRLRKASLQMIASHGDHLKCVAVVIEGVGFRAAITRSVLSGMALLHHRTTPATSFSNVWQALRWMSEHIPLPSVEGVALLVAKAREALDASVRKS